MLVSNSKPYEPRRKAAYPRFTGLVLWLLPALLAMVLVFVAFVPGAFSSDHDQFCSATSRAAFTACGHGAEGDFHTARAICINISNNGARKRCLRSANAELDDANDECDAQLDAREEVCELLGQARYEPNFEPDNFVDPNEIGDAVAPSPLFPLVVGNQWVYEGAGERVTVIVTDKTKLIAGVTCRVVNDVVTELDADGEAGPVIEDTDDWYAQDLAGNVHYCGERVTDFEVFEGDAPMEPELVAIDGSFKIGRDGAKSGFLVLANPQVGDAYRQEYDVGNAEDFVVVLDIEGSATTVGASCDGDCVVTRDFTPLDAGGAEENKFYAPGVGPILEVDLDTGERLELVSFGNVAAE